MSAIGYLKKKTQTPLVLMLFRFDYLKYLFLLDIFLHLLMD